MVFDKLNPEFKAKWLAALRSGEYGQTKEKLKYYGQKRMCCLGVACDVADPNGWKGGEKGGHAFFYYKGEEACSVTPSTLCKEINLDESAEGLLAEMNDTGSKFPEIADWIETNL